MGVCVIIDKDAKNSRRKIHPKYDMFMFMFMSNVFFSTAREKGRHRLKMEFSLSSYLFGLAMVAL